MAAAAMVREGWPPAGRWSRVEVVHASARGAILHAGMSGPDAASTIVVAGATGRQGGAVARRLLEAGGACAHSRDLRSPHGRRSARVRRARAPRRTRSRAHRRLRSVDECRALYEEVLGRRPRGVPMPVWMFNRVASRDPVAMWRWLGASPPAGNPDAVRAIRPEALTVPGVARASDCDARATRLITRISRRSIPRAARSRALPAVAHAADRLDPGGVLAAELRADAAHVHVDGARAAVVVIAPHPM